MGTPQINTLCSDYSRRGIWLAVAFLALSPLRAPAQGVFVAASAATTESNNNNPPFLLSVIPNEIVEAIGDYRRFAERAQWEKAFKQLEKLTSSTAKGLAPDADGIMVPPVTLQRQMLASLPADGKKAYQLFNDAEAKKLLDEARGASEQKNLEALAARFLFTSWGDVAADRLGDLYFEQGDMPRASESWRSILTYRPDSSVPPAQLLVKLGIAAARQSRWDEFGAIAKRVRDRYATETVTLGRSSASASEQLDRLSRLGPQAAAPVDDGKLPTKIRLAPNAEALWQLRWFAQGNPLLGNRKGLVVFDNMYGRQYASDFVPPAVADPQRVYLNLAGYDLGIDLETGKLLWRSGAFFDLVNKGNQNNRSVQVAFEQFGVGGIANRMLSVTRDPASSADARYNLVLRDGVNGKELFNSKNITDIRDRTMLGTPVVDGERIYVAAARSNQRRDLELFALNLADGKPIWNTRIGSYKLDPQQREIINRSCVPSLLVQGGAIYVDTHSGSLVQVSAANGQIAWGLNYESAEPTTNRRFFYDRAPEQLTTSAPILVDGVLYFKGMYSRRLYAVDPTAPKVLWSRPVQSTAILCGADRQRLYLGGEEVTAFDLKSQDLLWSVKVPVGTQWIRPLLTEDRIYEFTPRGIYEISKTDGSVVQLFRGVDMESLGGSLYLTPRALVAISNLAVTAYPIESVSSTEQAAMQEKPDSGNKGLP